MLVLGFRDLGICIILEYPTNPVQEARLYVCLAAAAPEPEWSTLREARVTDSREPARSSCVAKPLRCAHCWRLFPGPAHARPADGLGREAARAQVRLEFDFQREARIMDTVAGHLKARAPARRTPPTAPLRRDSLGSWALSERHAGLYSRRTRGRLGEGRARRGRGCRRRWRSRAACRAWSPSGCWSCASWAASRRAPNPNPNPTLVTERLLVMRFLGGEQARARARPARTPAAAAPALAAAACRSAGVRAGQPARAPLRQAGRARRHARGRGRAARRPGDARGRARVCSPASAAVQGYDTASSWYSLGWDPRVRSPARAA